ncbi:acetyl-CoA synthetase-like protein [Aspergillus lentulus]|uniref:Acetyl-CoA synthetase-like protein n=1 Tax=Aspergillus lentulus TaxID=293939 RepID=A0ABQ0ZSC5_ASPLE|nr:acetyl-CoA synthetase-like protein [Aspergillus lentulus]
MWESIKKGITGVVAAKGWLSNCLFWGSLRMKSWLLDHSFPGTSLLDSVVFKTVKEAAAWDPNAVGELPASVEIKLVGVPESGYSTKYDPPQGEILIRGPSLATGYYKNELETTEAFTTDQWFRTGDIGEWDLKGHLRIIDRKKNLVKSLNGEYIALEKLESICRSAAVLQNVCAYAVSNQRQSIAIVVPNRPVLQKLALEQSTNTP